MNLTSLLVAATLSVAAVLAHAQPTKFDGAWDVTLICPAHSSADDDARGYVQEAARVGARCFR